MAAKKNRQDNLIPFSKGFDPRRNLNGSPRKMLSTFTEIGYSKREVNDTILNILALTADDIKKVADNEDCTILERTIAKALIKGMEKGSLYNIETTLSRSIGTPDKPENTPQVNKIEVVFVKGKTIL